MTTTRLHHAHRSAGQGRLLLLMAVVLIAIMASITSPATAQSTPPSACPEMTDSVRRVYHANFNREPTVYEAFFWTGKYMNGEVDLPGIASNLARSGEFQDMWGSRTSSEFVQLIHLNTDRPLPSAEDLRHWTRALNAGYSRGEMTVALTETAHFVSVTNTAKPLSGYLRWYPPGTHWYCGSGSRSMMSVHPLSGDVLFVDRLVHNGGSLSAGFEIVTVENGFRNAVLASGVLPPGATDYLWSGALSGNGFYGSALQIDAPDQTRWAVVFYPRPIGRSRLGWEIGP